MLNNSTASDLRGVLKSLDIEVDKKPRTCGRQIMRDNVQTGPEDYFRKSITVSFLGYALNQIKTRFTNLHTRTALVLQLVLSIIEKYCHITEPLPLPVKRVSGSAPGCNRSYTDSDIQPLIVIFPFPMLMNIWVTSRVSYERQGSHPSPFFSFFCGVRVAHL